MQVRSKRIILFHDLFVGSERAKKMKKMNVVPPSLHSPWPGIETERKRWQFGRRRARQGSCEEHAEEEEEAYGLD